MNFIYDALTVLVPVAIGVWCITQARRIQRWAIKVRERENVKLFDNYVKSDTYLVVTRTIGVVCIVIGLLLLCVVARRYAIYMKR